jgi:hypothetical protein
MLSYTAHPCPACGATRGDWCQDHRGITKPGPLLICPARPQDEVLDCPVGLMVGDPHLFLSSTGVTVDWEVPGVEIKRVCRTCATLGSACLPIGDKWEEN